MSRKTFAQLSYGITDALERTPEIVAMTEGNGVVPMSWGNLASAIVECEEIPVEPRDIKDFLHISSSELRDPGMVFTTPQDVSLLEGMVKNDSNNEYRRQFEEAKRSDETYFENLFEKWKADDGKDQADEMLIQIRQEVREIEIDQPPEDYDARRRALNIAIMEQRALSSGYMMSAQDLIQTVFSFTELKYFSQAEIASALRKTLEDAIYELRARESDYLAHEVAIGEQEMFNFVTYLRFIFNKKMLAAADTLWAPIQSILIAKHESEHPTVTGNEK